MNLRGIRQQNIERNEFVDLVRRSQQTGLSRDPRFSILLRYLQTDPEDIEVHELVLEAIEEAEMTNLLSPDPFRATNPIARDDLPGTMGLGFIPPSGIPWLIHPDMLTTSALICGRTGGGKSNLIFLILAQLLKTNISVRVFDRKSEYHPLLFFPDFTYTLFNDYYTNWLEPVPGKTVQSWISALAEIMGNYLDIRVAARGLFVSKALWLCEQRRSTETGIYPTLRNVYQVIRNTKYPGVSHLARYRETLLNRLEGLFAVFGDRICSNRRVRWDKYLNASWGISLTGKPTDDQNLLISIEVARLMDYKEANNLRSDRAVHVLVFDEGSTMFKKWYELREGTYLLTDYLARCREFGMGFIIGTQTLSNLADSVLANTAIKVLIGGAGLGSDYDIFASATGMTQEQKEFIKQLTRPGVACARDPRYPHPFTLEVPRIV